MPHTRQGFTLVELVMVLGIIALLGAVAVPRYTDALNRYRARAAAEQIVRVLELSQATARQQSTAISVWFDVANDTVHAPQLDDPDRDGAWVIDLSARPWRAALSKADFDGQVYVLYNGYGETTMTGAAAVEAGGVTWSIELDEHGRLSSRP